MIDRSPNPSVITRAKRDVIPYGRSRGSRPAAGDPDGRRNRARSAETPPHTHPPRGREIQNVARQCNLRDEEVRRDISIPLTELRQPKDALRRRLQVGGASKRPDGPRVQSAVLQVAKRP